MSISRDVQAARLINSDVVLDEAAVQRPVHGLSRPLTVTKVTAFVFRFPITTPVMTSFGLMHDRPAVLLRVEDKDGAVGWGEIWANFPSCGAEHRARLAVTAVAPHLIGRGFADPADAFLYLERRVRTLVLQSGEWGPFAQVLAGVDIALWDLAARRAGVALTRLLGGETGSVAAYASGINPEQAAAAIAHSRALGYQAFKVKVGFGKEHDVAVVSEIVRDLEPTEVFMVDANQAWDYAQACSMVEALEPFAPQWLEEPLAADRPVSEWRALAESTSIPLAGGENLRGLPTFDRAIESGAFGVIQPDVCKWGGITGCLTVARRVLASGLRYCPHFLGAGIGLMASAHLLAAVGGDGALEVDSNPNPLREILAMPFPKLQNGRFPISSAPGLGVEPDLKSARQWLVYSESHA